MNLTEKHVLREWLKWRHLSRTDMFFLMHNVLDYPLPSPEVHGPIVDGQLQKFKGGTDYCNPKTGELMKYEPECDLWELEGPRKTLTLDPRGTFKTTVVTMSHSIQWVLNYYDIRILISMAIDKQNRAVLKEIKAHFQFNPKFRVLFPELCPPAKRANDFGTAEGFTIPSRKRKAMKEPTIHTCSIGSVIAGFHYEIIKCSDLVDKENVKTEESILRTIDHYGYMNPMLEPSPLGDGQRGWLDVEGTRYDFSDLYGTIQDGERDKPPEKRAYSILIRSGKSTEPICISKPGGEFKEFPENGKALYPDRWPLEELERLEQDPTVGPWITSCQWYNNPLPPKGGLATREDLERLFIPLELIKRIRLYEHVTIDLAGMEEARTGTDFTSILHGGFDRDGRMYGKEIYYGRFTPFEVINLIFLLYKENPNILKFKIEKEAHARVLLPFLAREEQKRGIFIPIVPVPVDTTRSKKEKLRALQPWYERGFIRMSEIISCKVQYIAEVTRFPKYAHDHILDCLRMMLEERDATEFETDMLPEEKQQPLLPGGKFTGFDPTTGDPMFGPHLYGGDDGGFL